MYFYHRSDKENILRMHNSVKLNELLVSKSAEAALVIVNLPGAPTAPSHRIQEGQNCILTIIIIVMITSVSYKSVYLQLSVSKESKFLLHIIRYGVY